MLKTHLFDLAHSQTVMSMICSASAFKVTILQQDSNVSVVVVIVIFNVIIYYLFFIIVIITGPPTYSVGGQTSDALWRLSTCVVVCRRL